AQAPFELSNELLAIAKNYFFVFFKELAEGADQHLARSKDMGTIDRSIALVHAVAERQKSLPLGNHPVVIGNPAPLFSKVLEDCGVGRPLAAVLRDVLPSAGQDRRCTRIMSRLGIVVNARVERAGRNQLVA